MEEDNEVRGSFLVLVSTCNIQEENQGDVDTDTEQALSSKEKWEDIITALLILFYRQQPWESVPECPKPADNCKLLCRNTYWQYNHSAIHTNKLTSFRVGLLGVIIISIDITNNDIGNRYSLDEKISALVWYEIGYCIGYRYDHISQIILKDFPFS